jgi:tetratricopeptide (TPR) repeat protein
MNDHPPIAQKLQAIEAYLQKLTMALQEGKLPVNIQSISQVFDQAIATVPGISLPSEKLCDIYNDVPTVLAAYAIAATIDADSYRQIGSQQVILERLYNGNYWIIPIAATPSQAWLVPNPTRRINLTRFKSLTLAFDWPKSEEATSQDTFTLVAPALVSTLPTAPLSWKLIERGSINSFLDADARTYHQSPAINTGLSSPEEIAAMVEEKVQERLAILESQLFDRLTASLPTANSSPPMGSVEDNPPVSAPLSIDDLTDSDSLVDFNPRDAQFYFDRAVAKKQSRNDPEGALADYDQAIILDPQDANSYNGRAILRKTQLNDFQGALADYNQAISLSPKYANFYFNRALLMEKLNNPEEALSDYDQAIGLDPENATAYFNRAVLKENDFDDSPGALHDYTYALMLNPENATAYFNRAVLKKKFNDSEGALADYNQTLSLNSENATAYLNRADLKADFNDFQGSLSDYDQAIFINPENSTAYNNRAILKENNFNYPEGALADYDRSISLNSENTTAYFNRAELKKNRFDDPEGALADYDQAILLDPEHAAAYCGRAIVRNDFNDFQGVIDDCNEVISLKPQYLLEALAYFLRGTSKAQQLDDITGSIKDLRQAAELCQEQGNIELSLQALKLIQELESIGSEGLEIYRNL